MKFNYLLGVGIVLSLIGVSLLVALGFLYIKPFMSTRHYVKGRCTLEQKNITDRKVRCQCSTDGRDPCTSYYPCAEVNVTLTSSTGSVYHHLVLYDSYETYELHKNAYLCSYHKCGRSELDNNLAVNKFLSNLESSFVCYHEKISQKDNKNKGFDEDDEDDNGDDGDEVDRDDDDNQFEDSNQDNHYSHNNNNNNNNSNPHYSSLNSKGNSTPSFNINDNLKNNNNKNNTLLHSTTPRMIINYDDNKNNKNNKHINNNKHNTKSNNNKATKKTHHCNDNKRQQYNSSRINHVLLDVVTMAMVVNSIFWPSLTLIVGFVIFLTQICCFKSSSSNFSDSDSEGNLTIGGHVTEVGGKNRSPFSSLERQWARIKERTAYNHHKVASERLFDRAERAEESMGHTAHVIG